jgi:hypothetical protein
MKLGAQLYTIRNYCKDTESLNESLKKVAAIGYKYIQLSGFPYDPVAVKKTADELGLSIILTHSPADRIINDTDKLIEEHIYMGCPNIGIGGFPFDGSCHLGGRSHINPADTGGCFKVYRPCNKNRIEPRFYGGSGKRKAHFPGRTVA